MNQRQRNNIAWAALVGLLLIMCVRMTIPEPIGDGVWSGNIAFLRIGSSTAGDLTGSAEVMGLGILTLLMCGIAMAAEKIRPGKWIESGIIAAVLAGAVVAIFGAANKFAATVGVFDLGMALLAGWSTGLLCNRPGRRRLVIAVLMGLLAAVTVKGIYQRYVEIPQTIHYFQKHQQKWLNQSGVHGNSAQVRLFISRLQSREVSGFGILSDGFAEILIPLLLIGLVLGAAGLAVNNSTLPITMPVKRSGKAAAPQPRHRPGDVNLPDHIVLGVLLVLLCLAGIAVLLFTRSKGGAASFVLCAGIMPIAWWWRHWLAAHRRAVIAAVLLLIVIAGLGVAAYGVTHHGLPTRDLLYRWDYWTGAAGIIKTHPAAGVGLNNFGYYYTQYKPPSAPEDVKAPHNMFIRIAAEAGIPVAILFTVLVLWGFLSALRNENASGNEGDQRPLPLAALIGFALLWWLGRILLDHPGFGQSGVAGYQLTLGTLYAAAAVAGMFLTNRLWNLIKPEYHHAVIMAAVLGAAGMVLYDQINMALATGPAAMFFWMILGCCAAAGTAGNDAKDTAAGNELLSSKCIRGQMVVGGVLCVAAVVLGAAVWVPTINGTLPWDAAAYRHAFKQAVAARHWPAALQDAEAVLQRDTRSQKWLENKIGVEMQMGLNPRRDVLKLLSINRTDARVRLPYALIDRSGLTVPERLSQLKLALKLNGDLPKDELERLSAAEVTEIQTEMEKLRLRH